MRIVFAGTPEFARIALAALCTAGHEIVLVLTQPDRKSGRGLRAEPNAVKVYAERAGLPVFQPLTLNDPRALERLNATVPEVMVVAAYGLILPLPVLSLPSYGAINIHASLLPRWRGAAPIQRALLAGDTETGITIMQMDAGLDTGPTLIRRAIEIASRDTAGSLHDKLAALGAELIVEAISRAQAGSLRSIPQPEAGVTYAHKILKAEAHLNWRKPAQELERAVRAFNPAPGARARLGETEIKIWDAHPISKGGEPGRVQSAGPEGIVVTCGEGALRLTELQRPGGKRLAAREFLSGYRIETGAAFALLS
jgi:methionyl-tRNA formyltransferase